MLLWSCWSPGVCQSEQLDMWKQITKVQFWKKRNHNFDTNQEVNVTIPIYKFFILYHIQIHVCYIQLQAVHFLKMAHILQ